MRKYLFTAIALLMGLTVHAQDGKSFYDTFEDGTANGWKAFAYQEGGPTTSHVSVVDNPLVAGANNSSKVLLIQEDDMANPYGAVKEGFELKVSSSDFKYIHLKVLADVAHTITVACKNSEGSGDNTTAWSGAPYTKKGEWEEVVVSIYHNFKPDKNGTAVSLRFFSKTASKIYIDDIYFSNKRTPTSPPAPEETNINDTFEDGNIGTWHSYKDASGITVEVVDNPAKDAVNPSNKVLHVKMDKSSNWKGAVRENMAVPVTNDEGGLKYLYFKVRKPATDVITVNFIKGDESHFTGYTPSEADKWEEAYIDAGVKTDLVNQLYLRPGNTPSEIWIDDIRFVEKWELTGIGDIQAAHAADAPTYTVSGVRVSENGLPKGIYIKGGKKFIVK